MRILVLCPLDEQHVYLATGIYKYLSPEAQKHCFAMPMFMQYAITTGLSESWVHAVFDALLSANGLYEVAQKNNDHLIVIGNMDQKYEFDVVFNCQDIEEALPYQDNFMEKIKEIVADLPKLLGYVNNLHEGSESILSLKNCTSTANFLSDYLNTDPNLEAIIKEYYNDIKILEEGDRLLYGYHKK